MDCDCSDDNISKAVTERQLGTDRVFGEVSVKRCRVCGRYWLRYFYENEGFTGSGRWFMGEISSDDVAAVTADDALALFEKMDSYHFGGSYFGGRTGTTSGPIMPSEKRLDTILAVLQDVRRLLDNDKNDFSWSGWADKADCLSELDAFITSLKMNEQTAPVDILFAPTGPIQEVSLSSGWGREFLAIAARFDALAAKRQTDIL